MKSGLYFRLSLSNIRKNYRFFIPRMLSEAGLLGCFYIALTLAMDGRLAHIKGGSYVPTFMWLGTTVMAILSAVLMLYTNSFLMKQRKKEFGLYNVLGMEKKHIGKVLFCESAAVCLASVLLGLCVGVLFYKLCSLLICRLLKSEIIVGFYFITPKTIVPSALFFIILDLFTYVVNRISIAKMKPVELLASKSAGEKEPKVKWLMLVLGVLALGGGYYISITTTSPLAAIGLFFVAVILVIIGTYFLFITGSTFVLKVLKNNKKYYYSKKHMPAVSGLLYRMKQNAVGLASVAVLSTGILIMVASTVSLYSGLQGTLEKNYPQHLYFSINYFDENDRACYVDSDVLDGFVRDAAEKYGAEISSIGHDEFLQTYYLLDGNVASSNLDRAGSASALGKLSSFVFITEESYTSLTGEKLGLAGKDTAVCRISTQTADMKGLTEKLILHGKEYRVAKILPIFPVSCATDSSIVTAYGIVVADENELREILTDHKQAYGEYSSDISKRVSVTFSDIDKASEVGDGIVGELENSIADYLSSMKDNGAIGYQYSLDTYWGAREDLVGMYGTLLFLGILLGAVCLFATVLIIYYKQISEGYEDRERFQIMEKIGMSRKEVGATIRSQVLLVFFLPLLTSVVHFIFAFPIIKRLLGVLMLYKTTLLIECSAVTIAVFALVYVLIYFRTSKTYYRIVH